MGTYTPNLNFYKPDATEFVDVETHLNRNWDIADSAVRRLLEYEYTNLQTPDLENVVDRSHFYKSYSNSFMMYFKSSSLWWQDPTANVGPWVHADNLLIDGWVEHHDLPVYYRIIKKSGGTTTEIEWIGAIWQGNAAIDLNTTTIFVEDGVLPTSIRPAVTKYWTTYAGNTTTNYSITRIFISNAGRMEFQRFGVDPAAGSDENRVELTGIKYNLEVTA